MCAPLFGGLRPQSSFLTWAGRGLLHRFREEGLPEAQKGPGKAGPFEGMMLFCNGNLLAGAFRQRLLPMEAYYDLLAEADCTVDMWKTIYCHVMPSVEAIAQWLKATGLRPFLVRLDKEEQALFLDRYITRLKTVYRPRSDGTVLLAFPRLFMVAKRR